MSPRSQCQQMRLEANDGISGEFTSCWEKPLAADSQWRPLVSNQNHIVPQVFFFKNVSERRTVIFVQPDKSAQAIIILDIQK